jgi:hypothetical protein
MSVTTPKLRPMSGDKDDEAGGKIPPASIYSMIVIVRVDLVLHQLGILRCEH